MARQRITKAEQANCVWFKAEITRRLLALGAIAAPNGTYDYIVATVAGRLYVSVYDNWIACRFEEPEQAKVTSDTRLNPYSGKWNHHYDDAEFKSRRTTQRCVDYFFLELDRYLPDND